ncbi:MAG: IS110 family transposase [Acidobacteria bacterium]|nr:IS110 family transposase [Acidobacteriota bacterium]
MEQPLQFAALIGIDWSDNKHDICLVDTATGAQELSVVKHTPEALNEWAQTLRARFGGAKVAVCLEQSRGPLIYALLKYDFLILYPINPKTLARFREAFTPSRAKDDPQDAEYLVELLIHHRERLKAWMPDDERTRTLQLLVEHRRRRSLRSDEDQQPVDGALEGLLSSSLSVVPGHSHRDGVRLSASLAEP